MARPARYNADYFTHTADLRNDRRVKAIRTKFGPAGYGLFHMLLEALTDADHTALDTSALELELLAGDFGTEASDIEALVKFAVGVGYFARNEAGLLTCPELSKWLEPVFEKRNRGKNPPAAALLSQPATETGVSVTETPQSKVKESKGEESEESSTSSFQSEVEATPKKIEVVEVVELPPERQPAADAPGGAADVGTRVAGSAGPMKATRGGRFEKPSKQDLVAYLNSLDKPPLNPAALADRFLNHYDGNGWKIGKNAMKDWQATARNWAADKPQNSTSTNANRPAAAQPTTARYNTTARGGFGGFAGPAPGGRAAQPIGSAPAGGPTGGPVNTPGGAAGKVG